MCSERKPAPDSASTASPGAEADAAFAPLGRSAIGAPAEPTVAVQAEIKVSREFELPPVPAAREADASKIIPTLTIVEPEQPKPAPIEPCRAAPSAREPLINPLRAREPAPTD